MKIDRFMSWCAASGLQSPLQIREKANTGYRYVVLENDAADYFHKNNRIKLVDVPLDICLISPTSDGLADRLLFEKTLGEDSFFAPYLDIMPSLDFFQSVLPRFWSPERWSLVDAGDQGNLYDAHELDQVRLKLSCDDWAQACVDSRSIYLPPPKGRGTEEYSLTPLLDMINHKPSIPTNLQKRIDEEADGKGIQTGRERLELRISRMPDASAKASGAPAAKSGLSNSLTSLVHLLPLSSSNKESSPSPSVLDDDSEEVFISYGSFTNIETLLNYGFVSPNNPCNEETIKVQMIRQEPVSITLLPDGTWKDGGIGQLRRYLATPKELEDYYAEEDKSGMVIMTPRRHQPSIPFLSRRNEVEVMALVGGSLEELVDQTREAAQDATSRKDSLVALYLRERCHILERTLRTIKKDFPEVFG
ncbi:hypothetical protein ACA910_000720 [Epithemia clementina (nom. ined.)]